MELQQIKYFLAVVDFGTFMAAAEQVHVSQPTLSAGIRKLEDSLKVTLLHRGSRAATLTSAGELFLSYARPAYNQLMSVRGKLSVEQSKLNLGVQNTLPMDSVAAIMKIYTLTNPHVFVEITVDSHEELSQMLKQKKLDLAFTVNHGASARFTPLFEEQLKIVVSKQHPFARGKGVRLKQLAEQPFIERIKCESWDEVHRALEKQTTQPLSVCRAEKDESVLALVAADLGISIMPFRDTPYAVTFVSIMDLQIARHIGIERAPGTQTQHVKAFQQTSIHYFKR